jgi:acyl carrier protein
MPLSHLSIRAAVIASLGEITGVPAQRITERDDLVSQLGFDSLDAASCIVAVEQRLGAAVPDGHEAELAGVKTVGEMIARLVTIFGAEGA